MDLDCDERATHWRSDSGELSLVVPHRRTLTVGEQEEERVPAARRRAENCHPYGQDPTRVAKYANPDRRKNVCQPRGAERKTVPRMVRTRPVSRSTPTQIGGRTCASRGAPSGKLSPVWSGPDPCREVRQPRSEEERVPAAGRRAENCPPYGQDPTRVAKYAN